MHLDFGQEPAGVTDRRIVFERLVGEYETSRGEALGVQVKCAVLLERVSTGTQDTPVAYLWFTTRLRHHEADSGKLLTDETVMAAEKGQWKSTLCMETLASKANTPRARKARTRAKEGTRVNTRTVLSLKATVVTVESGDTSKKTVDTKTLHDPSHTTTSWFVFSWNCAVHDGDDLHADGGSRAVWLAL